MLLGVGEPQSDIVLQNLDHLRLVLDRSQLLEEQVASKGNLLSRAIRLHSSHDSRVIQLESFPLLFTRSIGGAAGGRQREDVIKRELGKIKLLLIDRLVLVYLLLGLLVDHILKHRQQASDLGTIAFVDEVDHAVKGDDRDVELHSRALGLHSLTQLILLFLGTEEERHLFRQVVDVGFNDGSSSGFSLAHDYLR